jgi:branched-chain amino acid transport system substrate-binding protein
MSVPSQTASKPQRTARLLGLSASLLGCTLGASAASAAADDIKMGAILSIEGAFSAVGTPERDGIALAVAQINAQGGIGGKKIDLTVYDDGGDQAKAVELANRLIYQNKVSVAFGPTVTPTGEMAQPVFEQNSILNIGFLAQDYLWQGTHFIFETSPSDGVHAEAMVRYAADTLHAKTIAFAYANVPYGVSGSKVVAMMAKKYGLTIVAETKWGEDDIDFTPEAGQLHAAKADAILTWGSCAISDAQMFKALRATGDTTPVVGNLCMPLPWTAQVVGTGSNGAVSFSLVDYGKPSPQVTSFLTAFQTRYGHGASPFAAISYDGVQLWAKAVAKAGGKTDPTSVAAAMIGLDYDGIIGHFHITADNHFGLDVSAFKPIVLKDGVWSDVGASK